LLRFTGFLRLAFGNFPISHLGQSFYDLAPWRRLLIRDNQLTFGAFVKIVILGLAIRNHGETKKRAKQNATFKVVPRLG
jgi:hypothetical protein